MNYGQMRDYILQLINRYSVAGTPYLSSYNNQQDYINRIPELINDGLFYIASSIRKLPAHKVLKPEEGEIYGNGYIRHEWPEDCLEIRSGGLMLPKSGNRRWLTEYIIQEPNHILLPEWVKEEAVLEYYRLPKRLDSPEDGEKIDAAIDVQYAVCFYAAAHLVQFDDAYTYTSLYNEFERKAERLIQSPTTEIRQVHDVYGFGGGDCYG